MKAIRILVAVCFTLIPDTSAWAGGAEGALQYLWPLAFLLIGGLVLIAAVLAFVMAVPARWAYGIERQTRKAEEVPEEGPGAGPPGPATPAEPCRERGPGESPDDRDPGSAAPRKDLPAG